MKPAVALLLLASFAGCTSRAPAPGGEVPWSPASPPSSPGVVKPHELPQPPNKPVFVGNRDQIVMTAFAQVGKPYLYGGNGPDAFDCSGLVRYAYDAGGVRTPRTTATLFVSGQSIAPEDAQPGDLFFYRLDPARNGPSHVVLYLGDGEGIHAPSSGGAIRAVKLGMPYFSQRFLGARRLLQ